MRLREVGPGDAEVVRAACGASGAEDDVHVASFLERPEAVMIVAEDDHGIAGWAYGHELAHPDGRRTMLLYALDVVERARRGGIGRSLTTAFVDRARATGCTEMWVLTDDGNGAALATYTSARGRREAEHPVMFVWDVSTEGEPASPPSG
jgi:GNAT superfamily N-acetyltransferase